MICQRYSPFNRAKKGGTGPIIWVADLRSTRSHSWIFVAISCACFSAWSALEALKQKNLVLYGAFEQVSPYLNTVRFKNKKALFIIRARKLFIVNDRISIREKILQFPSVYDKREWLVSNVDGIGYKEASHFLRNIGFTDGITILDRHILKNLSLYGVIEEMPGSLSKKRYLDIEKSMIRFSEMLNIPVSHLDFILWFKETGDVFK